MNVTKLPLNIPLHPPLAIKGHNPYNYIMNQELLSKELTRCFPELYKSDGDPVTLETNYSGRGMFGRKCFAVTTDKNPGQFIAELIREIDRQTWEDKFPTVMAELADLLDDMKSDNMGFDTVYYFPSYQIDSAYIDDTAIYTFD